MTILGECQKMRWNDLVCDTATSKLPGEIVLHIATRLPVKSILRFKSVSKAWDALFSSPVFARSYLRNGPNKPLLMVQTHREESGNAHIRVVDPPCRSGSVVTAINPTFGTTLETELVGSINGLICLTLCRGATSIILWNPTIGKPFCIPKPKCLVPMRNYEVTVGFAYDEQSDCYIVIRIVHKMFGPWAPGDGDSTVVEIYSSRTNDWKQIEDPNFYYMGNQTTCGSIIHGSPHWFVVVSSRKHGGAEPAMMWFDASSEEFRYRPLEMEEPFSPSKFRSIGVGNEGDKAVAFAVKNEEEAVSSVVVTWRLDKELGVVEKSTIVARAVFCNSRLTLEMVLGFWRNGEIIAVDGYGWFVMYDPKAKFKKTSNLLVPPCARSMDTANVCEYIPSLVPPPPYPSPSPSPST